LGWGFHEFKVTVLKRALVYDVYVKYQLNSPKSTNSSVKNF